MTAPAIEVNGLRYSYPDGHEALTGVDLTVDRGERVAVLGPNGAGKTTLALHFNGILEPSRGTVTVSGIEVNSRSAQEVRQRIGMVFQDPNDQLFMPTVAADVAFGPANLGLSGETLERRVAEALSAVGAEQSAPRPPHHLSGGEKRLAAIATVLAMDPDVLVLDEPASGLDPAGRRLLIEVLTGIPVTQVVITHDLPLALELCPRTIVMDGGKVVAEGATVTILADVDLLSRHRLEMPFGFDPGALSG